MERKNLWSEASLPGLVLGLLPLACWACSAISAASVLTAIAELVKIGGCIYLMYWFIKRYVHTYDDISRSEAFRFGTTTALLAAIIYAGGQLAYVLLINPDYYQDAIDTVMKGLSSQLDSNSRSALDQMLPKLPTISFFSNLIYSFVFGMVVSAIVSGSLCGQNNPFDEDDED